MSDCAKVTACTSCVHKEVCKYKEGYLKVCEAASNINVTLKEHCEAASNINVTLKEHYEDGVRARIVPVNNFGCVEAIEVHCKYYRMDV